jgi:hypothetical protein
MNTHIIRSLTHRHSWMSSLCFCTKIKNKYWMIYFSVSIENSILIPKRTSLRRRLKTNDPLFLDFITQLLRLDPKERYLHTT